MKGKEVVYPGIFRIDEQTEAFARKEPVLGLGVHDFPVLAEELELVVTEDVLQFMAEGSQFHGRRSRDGFVGSVNQPAPDDIMGLRGERDEEDAKEEEKKKPVRE